MFLKDMILTAFIVLECGTESRGGSDVNGDNFFAVQSLDAHSKGCTGVVSGYRTRRIQNTILLLGVKRWRCGVSQMNTAFERGKHRQGDVYEFNLPLGILCLNFVEKDNLPLNWMLNFFYKALCNDS
jgi:hypothetical protein